MHRLRRDISLTSQRGVTTRDRMDCNRADAVIMNLLGAKTVSIWTMIEIGWADAHRTPIILVMERSANVHDHPMVRDCEPSASRRLTTRLISVMPEGKESTREIELEVAAPPKPVWRRRVLPLRPTATDGLCNPYPAS